MKKLFILAAMVIISSAAFAQLGAPLTVAKGDARYTKITDLFTPTSFDTVLVTAKATAPTKDVGTNTTDVATTAFVQAATAVDRANKFDRIFSELTGAQFIGPIANVSGVSPSLTLTDGTAIYDLYKIEKTTTVSKFAFILATQGNYTADNYNGIALLSYNPTTKVYTKIIESTDNGNIWKATALTLQEISFTPQVLQPGFYAVCTIWNATGTVTAAPVIKGFATIYQYNSVFIGHQLCGTRAAQATIPSTESYSNLSSSNTPSGIYLR